MSEYKQAGLFDRVASLLDVVSLIPDDISDEEVEGLLSLLPPDTGHTMQALFIPRLRAASLAFLKMVSKWLFAARGAAREGRKVILLPFNFPPEIVHVFGNSFPITSEVLSTLGVVALEGQGERYWDMAMGLGLPDHMCSANTIELGSILGSDDFKPHAVISGAPGGCDVNAKIHEFVAHYLDIPQFILEKPTDDSERGRDLFNKYMRGLMRTLEEFLGEELDEDRFRMVMEKANRCTELYHELWDLHKATPCPVPNLFSLFLYGTRFTMWGTDEGVRTLQTMVDVARERLKEKSYPAEEEVARTLWVYTSYYYDFTNFFNWMEEKGYTHLGDGLDCFFPQPVDTSSMESMIEGVTEAAWNMPMNRQVGGESMSISWLEDIVYACQDLKADCAIFCGHHACKQTWSVASILRTELMKRTGVPLLILQGDSWMKQMTPMSVIQRDIDEFITNVVARKGKRKRRPRRREGQEQDA
ncbi:MAG: 2-hydroxyacyl-CoA dehydratase family protein [Actinobacteria bacterium]|nr:2-hydroxyacyl-CoA dehydratase family protein [Actinomycetota bacterium]MCG2820245.1 2-hydroxyacyl-CoA dehydratase family protein [Actinomycetes bacterium]MBU4178823.1 2-hydroxyacyl-CoA dehydratase family protein [Actinomycetota bacterium]MBU4219552.1 2-hydroxyacyl-CoA dehydratase family protein [Actinomycetota bacterium]MBU4358120.1 2-hydroxyacyl-CoA dehydratase family protein [Actinomycetota bacterium]